MPDAAWAVSVHPPSLSREKGQPPVLTSSNRFSTLHWRFACWLLTTAACGGLRSTPALPLEAHADFLLGLIAEQPDLTLDEVVSAMRKRRIRGSRTAVWRFFERHRITFKKSLRAAEQERADVARARRRWMREQGMFDPARLVFIDETAANTKMVRPSGRCARGERTGRDYEMPALGHENVWKLGRTHGYCSSLETLA